MTDVLRDVADVPAERVPEPRREPARRHSASAGELTVTPAAGWYERGGKRVLDTVVATVLLGLVVPLLVPVMFVLRLTLGSGVLLRQRRVGRGGADFPMLKLRTMRHSRRTDRAAAFEGEDRRVHHKSAADPRHTPIGRWCRRLSIDELPQLWHVVRGTMSLVGPRPELAEVVDRHGLRAHERHRVRPGLTGSWQVTQRANDVPLHTCFDDDIEYVRHVSLRRDLAILTATVGAVLRGTGS